MVKDLDYVKLKERLRTDGFCVVRGLLNEDEVSHYVEKLHQLSGITPASFGAGNGRGTNSWNKPDGVSQNPDFWPLIDHPRLLSTVRALLEAEDIRYLQHNDLHVGFSAISWHRDNVNRDFGRGPDWNESEEPYRLVRVGLYLQSHAASGFRLGLIRGSHRFTPERMGLRHRLRELRFQWQGALSYLLPRLQENAPDAEWVATEPGDCIIFDPRAIHSGSYIRGPKYSVFVAYGVENDHFYNHWNYYRRMRPELGYGPLPSPLVERLRASDLYPRDLPEYDEIEAAWIPLPVMRRLVERRVRKA